MATPTYTAIATTTLASSASSVTFSSIDQSYGDLVLVLEFEHDTTNTTATVQFNNDTGNNYTYVYMFGDGSDGSGNSSGSFFFLPQFNSKSNEPVLAVLQIMDYSATDKHKTILNREGSTRDFNNNRQTSAFAGRYASTSGITSIQIDMRSGNLNSGSTFSLYGIAK